ncbi:hypothetical protein CONPUDRAFT_157874 [Coniophora puteana RWD-64-598 SS2]|uniref:Uncharacterized protein n=1 Tax=Coniophora puteana (strain RWD-64-598) TaxID=741705 RepID=A0A5M3MCX7_CONPW|nr:uncharacterized protein CONPUDRAFT_157874 [Coniophora puteana RWD-64-598 SS2]EIW76700.1 hypothetical protein CONPUDRAFT_157874 [Coniophora puteana RWD-64-598 SS2]
MPLTFVRRRVPLANSLQAVTAASKITAQVVNALQFPPAAAAATIVLVILNTIQGIQNNKSDCDRLARRAATILVDINEQMQGRWDKAPGPLLRNLRKYEETLSALSSFMKELADAKWRDRFWKKASIESAIKEHGLRLNEAAQSFHMATLIDIHYTVGSRSEDSGSDKKPALDKGEDSVSVGGQMSLPPYSSEPETMKDVAEEEIIELKSEGAAELAEDLQSELQVQGSEELTDELAEDKDLDYFLPGELSSSTTYDEHGACSFSRLTTSKGLNMTFGPVPSISPVRRRAPGSIPWKARMRYNGPKGEAKKAWLRDVKMLQNLYHPNLPQMLGFSDEKSHTPFITFTKVKTQSPQALARQVLSSANVAVNVELMLRLYRDLADTAMYTQQQLGLDENKLQDFIEGSTFHVDSKTLVVSLPPPRSANSFSARNYGIAHTLLNACLGMLPNNGRISYTYEHCDEDLTEDMQRKVNQVIALIRGLFPKDGQEAVLSQTAERFVEDSDFDVPLVTLRQIRDASFANGAHDHMWYERSVKAHQFAVGDVGYVPEGEKFGSFVRIRNVLEDKLVELDVENKRSAESWNWKAWPMRREQVQPFELPQNVAGWPVAVPPYEQVDIMVIHEAIVKRPAEAWRYLLANGKSIAAEAAVKPEQLILVTSAGTHQDFYIRDCRFPPPTPHGNPRFAANPFHQQQTHGFHQPPGFGGHGQFGAPPGFHHGGFGQPVLPSIFYLFTSLDREHEPYWSSSPMCVPRGAERPPIDRNFTYKIGWNTGFMHYVQLDAEDFLE